MTCVEVCDPHHVGRSALEVSSAQEIAAKKQRVRNEYR